MIFDFHTHCYSDALAPKAMSIIPKHSPFGPYYNGTLGGLKQNMIKNGVDFCLTLHHAPNARAVTKVNDWAIECQKEQGIYAFGSMHPDFENYKAELARLKNSGIKGLKFHPYYQGCDFCDKKMYAIYEEAAALDMIMLFHCGIDLLIEGKRAHPKDFLRLTKDFKGAKMVGAHLGGCGMWEDVFENLIGKEIYLDTSFAFRYLPQPMKERLIKAHNPSFLLFGSDAPWVDVSTDIPLINEYFSPAAAQKILFENAANLLKIKSCGNE